MRLKAAIDAGAVLPSVILRRLAAVRLGNALSRALRTLGRIERTLFTLQWLSDPGLRQRSHVGLNKGDAQASGPACRRGCELRMPLGKDAAFTAIVPASPAGQSRL